ncbi:hypothetical protein RESH_00928 [Rhodopirellula europaea SH398]|uniref:Uncharacterized protein n=1 Tax=Rhodopirellula europaea SH398 TaxID=1263868 RepID=M5S9Y6_9BACT|nr:hypothetical protein RESH_00928 [Rhodopirellula europaea SH398]
MNRSGEYSSSSIRRNEADHIFNIAINRLAAGTCLDHIVHRSNDEAYLDAVGAPRIPAQRPPVASLDDSLRNRFG